MAAKILHVLDGTTPADAVEILARVLPQSEHHLVTLGHRSTLRMMRNSGIEGPVTCLHSMGWADPSGWRGLRKVVKAYGPTHIHAWGIPSAVAGMMAGFKGRRVVTLVDLPHLWHMQLLSFIQNGGLLAKATPCHWVVTTSWLKHALHSRNIPANAVSLVREGFTMPEIGEAEKAKLREELGLLAGDGPIVLLGGDGGNKAVLAGAEVDALAQGGRGGPRHDLGMWATGILQEIFPRVRAVVREDPRGGRDPGLHRLLNYMANEEVTVVAPRDWSWGRLLGVADVMLVTPDGPFASGSVVQALAAGVPVVGTPVAAVQEHVTDGENGLIAKSGRAREIAAVMEGYLSNAGIREKLAAGARRNAAEHEVEAMRRGFAAAWES